MSQPVVKVWEVGILRFRKIIPSETMSNSQTFLGKKVERFEKQTCLFAESLAIRQHFGKSNITEGIFVWHNLRA